jgi:hypothetical protein
MACCFRLKPRFKSTWGHVNLLDIVSNAFDCSKHVGLCVESDALFILVNIFKNSPSRRHSHHGVLAIAGPKRPQFWQISTLPDSPDSEDSKTVLNIVRGPIFEELCPFKLLGILGLKTTIY